MSREYINDPDEDIAWTLRDIREALERIAKALEKQQEEPERTTVFAACPCCGVKR